uniref:Interleukin-17 receptor C n=1 Tax=Naja naja TaxID=35670 RepID=A0A8C6V6S3_NAJNA
MNEYISVIKTHPKFLLVWIANFLAALWQIRMLQGRQVLILYSPDHEGYERVVGILADALTQLQASVSLELWSRRELGSLGPMQWFHAQQRLVLQEGGVIVLLFSHGAVASCAEWLGWKQSFPRSSFKPDSTFLASLNCVLPDFLAGEARATYIVGCFEELLPVSEIPDFFCSVPVYPLPSQLFGFLLDLAGPRAGHKQRISLKRHAECIHKSLEQAVHEYPEWRISKGVGLSPSCLALELP